MKKLNRTNKNSIRLKLNIIFINITLAKFSGAVFTVIIIAILKYLISGNFQLEYYDLWNNIGIGLLAWTINTTAIGWLTEYLGIKGININLNQFIYGFNTMSEGQGSSTEDFKAKLYHAMEPDDDIKPNKSLDKGKGVDRSPYEGETNPFEGESNSFGNETKPLDKGKGIDRKAHPFYEGKGKATTWLPTSTTVEPPFVTWSRLNPGVDPHSVFFPKRINPGPGFNVPGGVVPIRDEICKHIDYNTHILSQFKRMDLETAIEQRNNNLKLAENMKTKIAYAEGVLSSQVPPIPTTDYQVKLKNQILRDLEELNRNKVRAEARATLLNSRLEFIELNRKPD